MVKALGRSQGAVSNSLASMAARGEVGLVGERPHRYRIASCPAQPVPAPSNPAGTGRIGTSRRVSVAYNTAMASTSIVMPGSASFATSSAVEAGGLPTMNSLRTRP